MVEDGQKDKQRSTIYTTDN